MSRKFIRYPLSSSFLIGGMVLVIITFFCGYSLVKYGYDYKEELTQYSYKQKLVSYIDFSMCNENEDIVKYINSTKGNIYISDVLVWLDNEENYVLIDILVSINEQLEYCLESGRFPTKEEIENGEHVVNIGRGKLDYTFKKNGSTYIKIEGEDYKVVGILGTPLTDIQDYDILMYHNCTTDNMKKKLSQKDSIYFSLASNKLSKAEFDTINTKIINSIQNIDNIGIEECIENSYLSVTSANVQEVIYLFLCIVCFVNCIVISELWIQSRKDELIIRFTFGYDIINLFKLILVDLTKINVIAMIISTILLTIIKPILKYYYGIILRFSFINIITLILMFTLVTLLLTCIVIKKIYKQNVQEQLFV